MIQRSKSFRSTAATLTLGLVLSACTAPPSTSTPNTATPGGDLSSLAVNCHVPALYVAERGAKTVAVYGGGASGEVKRLGTLGGPDTGLNDVWGLTFDASGALYAQSYLGAGLLQVFAPAAAGNAQPLRTLKTGPDARAIAVDAQGYSYVAASQSTQTINVYAPGAQGDAANGYVVAPVRTINIPAPYSLGFTPSSLALDSRGRLLVATQSAQGNAVLFYEGGANGAAAPLRVLSGPHTKLGATPAVADQPFTLSYSALTGRLYTATSDTDTSDGTDTRINVFASNVSGDMAPLRTITGPATGLSGQVVTGLASDPCQGNIYALSTRSLFGAQGNVQVFGRLANGNTAPLRSFTDAATHLNDSMGIVFAPSP